jgi:hypothetical protein
LLAIVQAAFRLIRLKPAGAECLPPNGTFLHQVWIFGGTTEIMKEIIGRGLGL